MRKVQERREERNKVEREKWIEDVALLKPM
jgi:hypothetical protein